MPWEESQRVSFDCFSALGAAGWQPVVALQSFATSPTSHGGLRLPDAAGCLQPAVVRSASALSVSSAKNEIVRFERRVFEDSLVKENVCWGSVVGASQLYGRMESTRDCYWCRVLTGTGMNAPFNDVRASLPLQ